MAAGSQTLDRGLAVLSLLAHDNVPLPLREIGERLGLHRSIVYRYVQTLLQRRLVERTDDQCYRLGPGVMELARAVAFDFRAEVRPLLATIATALNQTVILPVLDGEDLVCIASVEPRDCALLVQHREGLRQPLERGASGAAILSAYPHRAGERAAITLARRRGYATSDQEIEPGTCSIAVAVRPKHSPCIAAVALLAPTRRKPSDAVAVAALRGAAERIAAIPFPFTPDDSLLAEA